MENMHVQDGEYPNQVPKDVVVSVSMITYNHAAFIGQAIESVLMQKTDFSIELCIGEDRSTDGTREICLSYAQRYPEKIRLFLRSEEEKVKGKSMPPGRWNSYLLRNACRGQFIALLEGDDYWIDLGKLKLQVDYLSSHPEAGICATRVLVLRDAAPEINPPAELVETGIDYHLKRGTVINTCSMMYRRDAFADSFEWSRHIPTGDWALLLTALMNGATCKILPKVTSAYRVHRGGVWQGATRSNVDLAEMHIRRLREFAKVAPERYQSRISQNILLSRCLFLLRSRKYLKGLWIMCRWPSVLRSVVLRKASRYLDACAVGLTRASMRFRG